VTRIEAQKEIRRYLCSQFLNVPGSGVGIKGSSVHKLQGPGSHMQDNVFTPQLGPALDNATQSDMRKRAPDVGEHLNGFHSRWTRRQFSTAKRRSSRLSGRDELRRVGFI
jgi:hypothetical protein